MSEPLHFELNSELISAAENSIDWTDKKTWGAFAACVSFSVAIAMMNEEEMASTNISDIIRSSCDENNIYVARKQQILFAMYFSELGSAIVRYDTSSKEGVIDVLDELIAQGKMTIFIVGDYKERKIIDTFLHVNPEVYVNEYQAFIEMMSNQSQDQGSVPPPPSQWSEVEDPEEQIRRRIAWGEGYLNDDGEFVEF